MDAVEQKRKMREILRAQRRALTPEDIQAQTTATVAACEQLIARLRPPAIASYLASAGELDLDGLHRPRFESREGIFIPRVSGPGQLTWHRLTDRSQAHPGSHGIPEPDPAIVPAMPLPRGTLVFVPGVGFGRDGRRLGQSGGYYDRFLAVFSGISIGIGFTCQRSDAIPLESHDCNVHGLILGGTLVLDPTS
jgi:5-formyltetrahydrofolate cyclo-ligase